VDRVPTGAGGGVQRGGEQLQAPLKQYRDVRTPKIPHVDPLDRA